MQHHLRVELLDHALRHHLEELEYAWELLVQGALCRGSLNHLWPFRSEVRSIHTAIRLGEAIFRNDVHGQSCVGIAEVHGLLGLSEFA